MTRFAFACEGYRMRTIALLSGLCVCLGLGWAVPPAWAAQEAGRPVAAPATRPAKPAAKPKPTSAAKSGTPAQQAAAKKPGSGTGKAAVAAGAAGAAAAASAQPADKHEPPAPPPEIPKGSNTGLPLPRFAALRSEEVNLRSGPGTRYPIEWVYKRRDLPVEIEREFEVWRLVKDPEGVKGWVHQATLTGRRSFVVTANDRTMRKAAEDAAPPVAILKPGVIGRIRACDGKAGWCEVQVGELRGFLRRDAVWGIYPGEAVN